MNIELIHAFNIDHLVMKTYYVHYSATVWQQHAGHHTVCVVVLTSLTQDFPRHQCRESRTAMAEVHSQPVVSTQVGNTKVLWVPDTATIEDTTFARFDLQDRKLARILLGGKAIAYGSKAKEKQGLKGNFSWFKKVKSLRNKFSRKAVKDALTPEENEEDPAPSKKKHIRPARASDEAMVPVVSLPVTPGTHLKARYGLKGDVWLELTQGTFDTIMNCMREAEDEEDEEDGDDNDDDHDDDAESGE